MLSAGEHIRIADGALADNIQRGGVPYRNLAEEVILVHLHHFTIYI
jgi:hypothetical protein